MLFTAFDTNFTRVFAGGRIVLAVLCLLFAVTDPDGVGFQFEFDDVVILGWLIIALMAAPLVWSNWWYDHRLFPYVLMVDLAAFVLVPWNVEPELLGYFVVAPLIAAHLIAFSATYKGGRFATAVAIFLNIVCVSICVMHSLAPMGMSLGDSLRRVVLLLFVTVLMLWLCRNQLLGTLGRMADLAAPNRAAALDHGLAFAMAEGQAGGALAGWSCGSGEPAVVRGMGSLQPIASQDLAGALQALGSPGDLPTLFDLIKGRGLALDRNRHISIVRPSNQFLEALRQAGVKAGAFASLSGSSGEGWLVLTGVKNLNRFDLNRVEAIADRIGQSMDRHEAGEASRLLALSRLREAVARDLHDGVAQSLAGAKYWLQALRGKLVKGVCALDDLDRFAGALDSEYTHLREMITTMRLEQEPHSSDLREALRELAAMQAQHWRAAIEFTSAPEPIAVRQELSFEIRQILRECIANSVRHGRADRISIRLTSNAGVLNFAIEDNGVGFDTSQPVAIPRTIAERVTSLGGSVQAQSKPGCTRIEFAVSLGDEH